jgi:hypothetical protein
MCCLLSTAPDVGSTAVRAKSRFCDPPSAAGRLLRFARNDSKLAKGCHREERSDEAIPVTNERLLRGFLPMAGDDLLGLAPG